MSSLRCYRCALLLLWLANVLLHGGVAMAQSNDVQIEKIDYQGWKNTYRLKSKDIEVSVVTDVGPRIIDLRVPGGENLLQKREGIGQSGEDTYQFRGGWRLWIAPERKETTYVLDNSPCAVTVLDDHTIRVVGPPQPQAGIQKSIEVRLQPDAHIELTSRITNIGSAPVTYAGWSLPVLRPGGRAFIPLDLGSLTAFDATRSVILWSYAQMSDPRYRWGDRMIEIDHRKVTAGADRGGGRRADESKIAVDSKQGWAAYLHGQTLFLKRFETPPGNYPDSGSTIEVYSNQQFLELENLGPLTTLAPGAEMTLPEHWWLFDQVAIPEGEAPALAALQPFIDRTK